jgi:hypothetical protein
MVFFSDTICNNCKVRLQKRNPEASPEKVTSKSGTGTVSKKSQAKVVSQTQTDVRQPDYESIPNPDAVESSSASATVATVSETVKSTDESDSESEAHTTAERSDILSSGSFDSDQENSRKIKRVFRWFLWGWVLFFILAWFLNHDLKFLMEIMMSVVFGAVAALISTLIYWGILEFRKSKAGTVSRADAAESEIAELRRKVEELSRKS